MKVIPMTKLTSWNSLDERKGLGAKNGLNEKDVKGQAGDATLKDNFL
jgi:hypothetical protein